MPRVGDLSKCKIYKITSLNNPDMVYYGHTCQTLARRFATHKKIDNRATSKLIIEKGDAIILLIEDYPCETENQATSREAFYILNNPCVNKQIPGRTPQEYKKEYNIINKEKISEKNKIYHEANKVLHLEKMKEYRESHQEEIKAYKKQHAEKNKEKLQEYKKQYYLKKKLEKLII